MPLPSILTSSDLLAFSRTAMQGWQHVRGIPDTENHLEERSGLDNTESLKPKYLPVAGQALHQLLPQLSGQTTSQRAENLHKPKHLPSRYVDTIMLQVFMYPKTQKSHLSPKFISLRILNCLPCKISC